MGIFTHRRINSAILTLVSVVDFAFFNHSKPASFEGYAYSIPKNLKLSISPKLLVEVLEKMTISEI
jgi:hypothetical protein